MIEVIRQMELD